MWTSKIISLNHSTKKYTLFKDNRRLSFKEVLILWSEDEEFRKYYNKTLKNISFTAYFWEHPPINITNLDQSYQMVITESMALNNYPADPQPFESYFQKNEEIVSFLNLGKDALLIAPTPQGVHSNYMHLGSFTRNANYTQTEAFWQSIGTISLAQISESSIWLNTAGLGVFWLHVRLDSFPKYYKHKPYRDLV